MNMEKIQTGLRIPKEQYDKLKAISDRTGISVNSMALHGLELWLMDFEAHRVPFHNQQDTA